MKLAVIIIMRDKHTYQQDRIEQQNANRAPAELAQTGRPEHHQSTRAPEHQSNKNCKAGAGQPTIAAKQQQREK